MDVQGMIAEYENTIERLQGLLLQKQEKRLLYHKEIMMLIEEIGDVRFALRLLRGYCRGGEEKGEGSVCEG